MTHSVGILALQGATRAHARAFARLGVEARDVRRPEDLDGLDGLVLPGGESTTLHHLMTTYGLWEAIERARAERDLARFGTCAGAILLGRAPEASDERPPRFGFLDADVERNGFGRQAQSDVQSIRMGDAVHDVLFIRAPRIVRVGPEVEVLARLGDEPVAIEAPGLLATTFHPELGDELLFHRRFLERTYGV